MKQTGMIRPLDSLNRVVVPRELCKTYGFGPGTPMEFFTDGDNIILREFAPGCIFCGEAEEKMTAYNGQLICQKCRNEIREGV